MQRDWRIPAPEEALEELAAFLGKFKGALVEHGFSGQEALELCKEWLRLMMGRVSHGGKQKQADGQEAGPEAG